MPNTLKSVSPDSEQHAKNEDTFCAKNGEFSQENGIEDNQKAATDMSAFSAER